MFFLLFILLFLLLILFIPIPLKFYVKYSDNFYEIKLYNINIISSNGGIIKKIIHNKKIKGKNIVSNEEKVDETVNKKIRERKLSIKLLLKKLSNNKFKPRFTFNSTVEYSLSDAARTAIFYGILNSFNPFIYKGLSIPFKIKDFNNSYKAIFEDKTIINISIMCILTFNIAEIIYMLFLIMKSNIPIRGGAQ